MRIFVGNLAYTTTEEDLAQLFHPYGEIERVQILTDRHTRRSRGFGFVEMPDTTEAKTAIAGLNGTVLEGRPVTVSEAHRREGESRPPRPRQGRRPNLRWPVVYRKLGERAAPP